LEVEVKAGDARAGLPFEATCRGLARVRQVGAGAKLACKLDVVDDSAVAILGDVARVLRVLLAWWNGFCESFGQRLQSPTRPVS